MVGDRLGRRRRIEEVNNIRISCSEYTYKTISQTIHLTQFNIILLILGYYRKKITGTFDTTFNNVQKCRTTNNKTQQNIQFFQL